MVDDGVRLISAVGQPPSGERGSHSGNVSISTAGAEKICVNVASMPPRSRAKTHFHENIATIAYLLEGECKVFHGSSLESRTAVRTGEKIFIPGNVPHGIYNVGNEKCVWIVVHFSGSDQDGLVLTPELEIVLDEYKYFSKTSQVRINELGLEKTKEEYENCLRNLTIHETVLASRVDLFLPHSGYLSQSDFAYAVDFIVDYEELRDSLHRGKRKLRRQHLWKKY